MPWRVAVRRPDFGIAWSSHTLSGLAAAVTPVLLTLTMIDGPGGLGALGMVLGARTLGFVLGGALGGVITDRFSRRTVLAAAGAVRGAAILGAAGSLAGPVELVAVLVLIAGIGEGLYRGAYQALIGEVVPEAERHQANALSTLSSRLLLVVGPALATVLQLRVGGGWALTVTGLCWLVSALVALRLRPRPRPELTARRHPWSDFRSGLAEVRKHRWFVAGLAALVVWLTLGFAVQQLTLPGVSRMIFGGDGFLGLALGCYSAGAVLAAVIMGRWRPRRPGLVGLIGLSGYGLVPLMLAITQAAGGSDPSVWMLGVAISAAYALGGFGIEAFNIGWFGAIQREVPIERQGRVFSFDFMVSYGIAPLGLVALPALLTGLGTVPVLIGCGVLTIAAALAVLLVPGATTFSDPGATNDSPSAKSERADPAHRKSLR